MKRFDRENTNTPEEYENIFLERKKNSVDGFDAYRWREMLKYFKGGRLIDMGCLDSLIPLMAKKEYQKSEVWGIDRAQKAIEYLKDTTKDVIYVSGDVYDTGLPGEYFDYVTAGELIEHLEDPELFFKEAFRILKRYGTFVLTTPLGETERGEVDHIHHLWSFDKKDISSMLGKYGRVKIKLLGSTYFPKYEYHFPTLVAYCKKL